MSGGLFDDVELTAGPTPAARDAPLADRMRPRKLSEVLGPPELVGPDSFLARAIAEDRVPSLVFWGPPGSGKTTLARLIAAKSRARFVGFSAVVSGIREIRAVIEEAARPGGPAGEPSASSTKATASTGPSSTPSSPSSKLGPSSSSARRRRTPRSS